MLLHRAPHVREEQRSSTPHDVDRLHELPELPEGVEIPDDLSGLEPPARRRWLPWTVAVALIAIAAAAVLLVWGGGDTEQAEPAVVLSPAAEIVQAEVADAAAQQQVGNQVRSYYEGLYQDYLAVQPLPAYRIVEDAIADAIDEQAIEHQILRHYEQMYVPAPAYQIIQDEIDAAVAEQAQPAVVMTPAAEIIQDEIDHALNEQAVLNDILAYYEDLAASVG